MTQLRNLLFALTSTEGPFGGPKAWLWNFRYRLAYGRAHTRVEIDF